MKIDFKAAFTDLQRLVDKPARDVNQAGQGAPFKELLLHSIAPRLEQAPGMVEQKPWQQGQGAQGNPGVMASYRFAPAPSMPPSLAPLSGSMDGVKAGEESVKTPTVVDVRKIPHESPEQRAARLDEYRRLIDTAGNRHGIDPALSMAVASAESSFNPTAVSSDGHFSKGLFQLLDTTGRQLHQTLGVEKDYDPFDPAMNVDLGVGYLRRLHELFSQPSELANKLTTVPAANSSSLEKLAVAAFNAGEGRVAYAQLRAGKAGADPTEYANVRPYLPDTTQDYVDKVMQIKAGFEGEIESPGDGSKS